MVRVDARGLRCPWPAIRLARALREAEGAEIEVLADDPAAERELRQLAHLQGAELYSVEVDRFIVSPRS